MHSLLLSPPLPHSRLTLPPQENESCLGAWITNIRDRGNVAVTCHTSAHTQGEVSDVATHPSRDEFVTVGDDGVVRIWGYEERTPRFVRNLRQVRVNLRRHLNGNQALALKRQTPNSMRTQREPVHHCLLGPR